MRARFRARLTLLYGEEAAPAVTESLCKCLQDWQARYPATPGAGDAAPWDQSSSVFITYGDSIQESGVAPLRTLNDFLKQHLAGAIDTVHILPFFPYSSDDGFSVIDYREVRPELGTWDDVSRIAEDYGLMVDLVINHCSRNGLWFVSYLVDQPPYNEFFLEAEPQPGLALVTRPRSSPLLTEVRTLRGVRHVWTTFSSYQVDLDFRNPAVLLEMIDILLGYVAAGARIVRLDAVAFLWKEIGTTCLHLPQTHEMVKLLRDVVSVMEPRCLVLTETNVPNAENRSYFGDGDEAQIIYQFSLPPLLLHALHTGRTEYLQAWAQDLEANPPPAGCTYLNFTASHDGVGLRPLEGLLPAAQLDTLLDGMRARGGYVSSRRRSDGSEAPYELNISYFDAFRDPHVAHDPWHIPCFLVSQIVALSMQGIPALYVHALTATLNDHLSVELLGRTRAINRRKWDRRELEARLADRSSETARVFHELVRVLRLRRAHPAFHPDGPQHLLALGPRLFGFLRQSPDGVEQVLCLFNFTPETRELPLAALSPGLPAGQGLWDLLSDREAETAGERLRVPGYAAYWLVAGSGNPP
jgi:sucrose phosphorylase